MKPYFTPKNELKVQDIHKSNIKASTVPRFISVTARFPTFSPIPKGKDKIASRAIAIRKFEKAKMKAESTWRNGIEDLDSKIR